MFRTLLIALLFPLALLSDEPWGKDADLTQKPVSALPTRPAPILGAVSEALVHFHQRVISPCDGPRSHFIPSSSQYALDAIHTYGFLTGFGMGCDRLMRENKEEWVYRKALNGAHQTMKYDPVPSPCTFN